MGKIRSDHLLADYISKFAKKRGFENNPIKAYALLNLVQYLGERKDFNSDSLGCAKVILNEPNGELADYLVDQAGVLCENDKVISMFWDMVHKTGNNQKAS